MDEQDLTGKFIRTFHARVTAASTSTFCGETAEGKIYWYDVNRRGWELLNMKLVQERKYPEIPNIKTRLFACDS